MKIDVKPLTHWAIYRKYTLRFRSRTPGSVTGVATSVEGKEMAFDYLPAARVVQLPGERVRINEYGWEEERWMDQ